MKDYLTVEEVAPYCHTSVWTIYRRIKQGALGCIRAGGGRIVLIPVEEVRRFLTANGMPIPPDIVDVPTRTRVLLVDDDEKLVRSLERYFNHKEEFEFRSATSGFAAGVALKTFQPKVILLDIMLGDMDGRELLRVVRQDPEHRNARVIAMSGYVKDAETESLFTAGFDDYVPKPFALPDLLARITKVLAAPVH